MAMPRPYSLSQGALGASLTQASMVAVPAMQDQAAGGTLTIWM